MQPITISPLRGQDVMAVARLHVAGLSYSLNSKLGPKHLAQIYETISARPDSYVGVALCEGVPVGVVSGTVNPRAVRKTLILSLGFRGCLRVAGNLLLNPSAFLKLLTELRPRPPVKVGGQQVNACLTALAIAPSHRRRGFATQLVAALEDFFHAHCVSDYWLDTIAENTEARSFYRKLGFTEVSRIAETIVLVKHLTHDVS